MLGEIDGRGASVPLCAAVNWLWTNHLIKFRWLLDKVHPAWMKTFHCNPLWDTTMNCHCHCSFCSTTLGSPLQLC